MKSHKKNHKKKDKRQDLSNKTSPLTRLNSYIASSGVCSRRQADREIADGNVTVNGVRVVALGSKIDPGSDTVKIGNRVLRPEHKGIILLHKPRNVISTTSDPEGRPTVLDFLTTRYHSYYPVGRLDFDATGLVVLTNDGELAEQLMHPKYGHERAYEVRVEGHPKEGVYRKIAAGVTLHDGKARADVRFLSADEDTSWLLVRVTEGRNHLIKRIFEKVEHPVVKLKRTEHGPFKLGSLRVGDIRKLTEIEYERIRRQVLGPAQK